jgi:hypothetical protein
MTADLTLKKAMTEFKDELITSKASEHDLHLGQIVSVDADGSCTILMKGLEDPVNDPISGVKKLLTPTPPGSVCVVYQNGVDWIILGSLLTDQALDDQFFAENLSTGTATSYTAFSTHNSILTAPCDLTMIVRFHGHWGFSGSPNTKHMKITDEAGVSIMGGSDDNVQFGPTTTNIRVPLTAMGHKDYSAGDTCGYRLQYLVDSSNVYINGETHVQFVPKS